MRYPEYVAIGHVTNDLFPEEKMIGGSVVYSALTAHYIGYSAGIITSSGQIFPVMDFCKEFISLTLYLIIRQHFVMYIIKDKEPSLLVILLQK